MDREIKFRFWDALDEKMLSDVDIEEYTLHSLRDFEGELLQFTGLKDKNGVEIYENDVVNAEYFNNNLEKIKINLIVEWGDWCYILKFKDNSFYSSLDRAKLNSINAEVIGNIFENPELIK